MGERKGTNKYYPPDYDPKKGGLNKFMGTHALRERARKLHMGILIIRFEMPYNIWCDGCNNHIGMGVRYNAEKSKVGMYYTTPVYKFRMKCHLCSSHFEMQTDPGNLDYIILNGARRVESRWDPTENGQVVTDDKQVIRQLSSDPMFKLEHGMEDKTKLKNVTPTLAKLEGLQERWKDDYSANKIMRSHFRTKKKEIKAIEDKDNEFLEKNSLNIPLLSESVEDSRIASLLKLEPIMSSEERQQERRTEIESKSKFPSSSAAEVKSQLDRFYEKSQKYRSSLGISIGSRVRSISSLPSTSSPCTSSVTETESIKRNASDSNEDNASQNPSTDSNTNGDLKSIDSSTNVNNKRSFSDESVTSTCKIPKYSSTIESTTTDIGSSTGPNGTFSLVSGDYCSSDEFES